MQALTTPAVGAKLRVWTPTMDRSRLAIVSYIDESTRKVDVFYDSENNEEECKEECGVELSRLGYAEPWELICEEEVPPTPMVAKDRGNTLMTKQKDFLGAERQYRIALDKLSPKPIYSVGTTVLLTPFDPKAEVDLIACTVVDSYPREGIYDVLVENGPKGDEDLTISSSRVAAALAADSEARELQRSLFINLARCILKREQPGWAVRFSSLALVVAQLVGSAKGVCDARTVRAKSLLQAGATTGARKDCRALNELGDARGVAIEREIEAFLRDRHKSNRKMATDIAKWAEVAMLKGGHIQPPQVPVDSYTHTHTHTQTDRTN